MSSNFKQKDGYIYDTTLTAYPNERGVLLRRDPLIISTAIDLFDQQVEFDLKEEESKLKNLKTLRRVCLFKLITFPLDWISARIFIGKAAAEDSKFNARLYWNYYRNRISFEKFSRLINRSMEKIK